MPPVINMPNNCAVLERTGDGRAVGRCYYFVENGKCPRHGDVSAVMEQYRTTGKLTDENDLDQNREASNAGK